MKRWLLLVCTVAAANQAAYAALRVRITYHARDLGLGVVAVLLACRATPSMAARARQGIDDAPETGLAELRVRPTLHTNISTSALLLKVKAERRPTMYSWLKVWRRNTGVRSCS